MKVEIKRTANDFYVEEIPELELDDKGDYSYYWLTKEEMNTLDVINRLSDKLNKRVNYAGLKDKKAVTKQVISVKNGPKALNLEGVKIEYIGKGKDPVFIGNLKGNKFKINVYTEKEPKIMDEYINYFGEQRFSKNNDEIGLALLKRDFKKACELIGNDYNGTVSEHISMNKNDYVGALRKLNKRILNLFVHAYQSKIWNETAKKYDELNIDTDEIKIVGFGYSDDISSEIMSKDKINERNFIIKEIKEISGEGGKRKFKIKVKVDIEKIKEGYKLKFELPKGSYATSLIDQIF